LPTSRGAERHCAGLSARTNVDHQRSVIVAEGAFCALGFVDIQGETSGLGVIGFIYRTANALYRTGAHAFSSSGGRWRQTSAAWRVR
jgi:hypothetical protein